MASPLRYPAFARGLCVNVALTVHKGLWDLEACGAAFSGYEAGGEDVPLSRKWGQRC